MAIGVVVNEIVACCRRQAEGNVDGGSCGFEIDAELIDEHPRKVVDGHLAVIARGIALQRKPWISRQALDERPAGCHVCHVRIGDAANELLEGVGVLPRLHLQGAQAAVLALEHAREQIRQRREIAVDERLADAGVAGDSFHVQGGEAVVGDELGGGVQDLVLTGLRGQSSPLAGRAHGRPSDFTHHDRLPGKRGRRQPHAGGRKSQR